MKKRIISLLMAVLMLAGMMSVSAFAAFSYDENNVGGTGTIVVEAPAEVNVGAAFDVVIKLDASAAALQYEIAYDSKLQLVKTTAVDAIAAESFLSYGDNGIWVTGDDITGDNPVLNGIANKALTGEFMTLTFKATEEVESAAITVSALGGTADEKYVTFADASDSVKAVKPPYTLGDVVVDGSFDILDVQKACMVFLGVETFECAPEAADVVVDGTFDIMDVQKFCMVFLGVESF